MLLLNQLFLQVNIATNSMCTMYHCNGFKVQMCHNIGNIESLQNRNLKLKQTSDKHITYTTFAAKLI